MIMTDFEITRSYRRAIRPESQLKILAELNATTVEYIERIIKRYEKSEAKRDRDYRKALRKVRRNDKKSGRCLYGAAYI